jgi:hypothetical protein
VKPLLLLGILFTATLHADTVLVQKVEAAGRSSEMTVKIKGTKIRSDISPEISTLTDTASGATTTLMHPQKAYMEISAAATRQLLDKVPPQAAPEPVLEPTGKHETVNGYDTEIYTVETGALKTRYWIAKDYPDEKKLLALFKELQNTGLGTMARQMAPQPTEFPGVPLKTELQSSRSQKVTVTLLSVEEEPLPDSDFVVPPDYKALPTPDFGPSR